MKATLLAILLLAIPGAVSAQSTAPDIDDVRTQARVHAGPFYFSPSLLLKELGVDSNVFNEGDNEKSDFTFTLAPALEIWVPMARRVLITTALATDLVWFAKYDTERSVDPQASVRADVFVRRIRLFVGASYQNTRQRLNYELDVRSRHLQNEYTAGAEVKLTPKFSVEAAGRYSDVAFDADAFFLGTRLQDSLNRRTRAGVLTARHELTPLTAIVVRAEQSRDDFEFAADRNSESVRVLPGVEFKPRALVSGSAFVGVRRFSPQQQQTLPAFEGVVAQMGLSHTILGTTTVGISYTRDLQYSFEPLQPYYVLNGVGASIRQALGSKFDVLVSGDRLVHDYRNALVHTSSVAVPPLDAREDVVRVAGASLGYRLGRDARIGAGVSYQERRSTTQSLRDYNTVRFVTTVSYGLK